MKDSREMNSLQLRADIFKALGHPIRLWIIEFLADGPRSVAEIANEIEGGLSSISQQLAMLRQCGIIRDERRSRQIYYSIVAPCVLEVCAVLSGKTLDQIVTVPKQRRGIALSTGTLATILVISCSLSALLWAIHPYLAQRPAPPPHIAPIHPELFANRLEKRCNLQQNAQLCTCGLPADHSRKTPKETSTTIAAPTATEPNEPLVNAAIKP